MFGIEWQIILVFAVLILVFCAFLAEKYPPDLIAMGGFLILILSDIFTKNEILSVFSSSAPITIGAMFIISSALERTGLVDMLGKIINQYAGRSYTSLLLCTVPLVMVLSAFMNNTPVVMILTPLLIKVAYQNKMAPTQILIPLSFAAILGGTLTLIGTSTNLLVHGLILEAGLTGFNIFSITSTGLVFAVVGLVYLLCVGRYLLPNRFNFLYELQAERKVYLAHLYIAANSELVGKTLDAISQLKRGNATVLEVVRNKTSYRYNFHDITIKPGDIIVVETDACELIGLSKQGDLLHTEKSNTFETLTASDTKVVQGIVRGGSRLLGHNIFSLLSNKKIPVYLLGLHRAGETIKAPFQKEKLKVGDTLLVKGSPEDLQAFFQNYGLVNLSEPSDKPIKRNKAPFALGTLIGVIVLAAFNVMPIVSLSLIGAGLVIATRCIEPEEIYEVIEWRIIFMIFGMLGIGLGMEKTGAARLIINSVVDVAGHHGPLVILAAIYALSSTLTEVVTNNAVAVVLTPIVIGIAQSLGLSPYPFIIAVMFGASASFATPIGYQTNTFVYNAGGYKFTDFLKVGIPLNIIMLITAVLIIPLLWPF
jgi:di/tricarboxylate transporter